MPFRLFYKNKKQFRTAQLHIRPRKTEKGEERTPRREGMLCSLSVEAAVALPVFLAAMCLLMFPMKVIQAESVAQRELEQAAEYICVAEGLRMAVKTSVQETEEELSPSKVMSLAEDAYSLITVVNSFDTDVFEYTVPTVLQNPSAEDPCLKVKVLCTVRYPFTGLLGDRIQDIRLVTYRRAWVGRKGGAGRSWAGSGSTKNRDGEEKEDRIVYVARNSSKSGRYHVSAQCHYISNEMSMVSKSQAVAMRNKDGGKYHPCPSCQAGRCENVYVFEHGDAYHSTPACKANRSYAVEMKESEAIGKGLSPCSYCSRKYGS